MIGFVGAELAYFKSSWDEGDVWQLQGVMCTQEEMDAYIASLSLSEPGESVSVSGYREFSLDLPSEALGDVARKLDALSFASCLASGDIDGDGRRITCSGSAANTTASSAWASSIS